MLSQVLVCGLKKSFRSQLEFEKHQVCFPIMKISLLDIQVFQLDQGLDKRPYHKIRTENKAISI